MTKHQYTCLTNGMSLTPRGGSRIFEGGGGELGFWKGGRGEVSAEPYLAGGGRGGSSPPDNRGKKCPFCEQVPFF